MKLKDAINNTKKIYMSDSGLQTLLDFERVLDEVDIFGFENWFLGELVEGPTIEKYWVTCKFMWPKRKMPDPRGAARLLPYGCKITYEESKIKIPVKIKSPDDYREGSRKPRLVEVPVWLVEIRMPQELISDIETGSLEIANEEFDLEDIQQAYQQDIDEKSLIDQEPNDAFTDDMNAGGGPQGADLLGGGGGQF